MPFGHEKLDVDRAAMLAKLGQRGYALSEELGGYRVGRFDTDADVDTNTDTDADSGTE
jgi:hypothetical protein